MRGTLGMRACGISLLAALATAAVACRGGDRADATADTAVAAPGDTTRRVVDSAVTHAADSAHVDTTVHAPVDTAPLLLVAVDSAIGDSLYQKSRGRCLSCHGPRGIGNASLGPSLRDSVRVDSNGSLRGIEAVIHDGVAVPKLGTARMPAFGGQLDSVAIHRIAVYVYSLSHPGAIARDSAAARAALPAPPPDTATTKQPTQ
ncbi:MAG: c-type cytochrome [Gemmatimonadaceae bacterium]